MTKVEPWMDLQEALLAQAEIEAGEPPSPDEMKRLTEFIGHCIRHTTGFETDDEARLGWAYLALRRLYRGLP